MTPRERADRRAVRCWPIALAVLLLVTVSLVGRASAGGDTPPPPFLLAVHRAETPDAALTAVATADDDALPPAQLAYLRATLLERAGHRQAAKAAFGQTLAFDSPLAERARLHLARLEATLGHPEVAAGIVASLVASTQDPSLRSRAAELLRVAIADGGDCRLLAGLETASLDEPGGREIHLTRAICALRDDRPGSGRRTLLTLLDAKLTDDVAYRAALVLGDDVADLVRTERVLVAAALHQHRDFDAAIAQLEPIVDSAPRRLVDRTHRPQPGPDPLYLLARSHFWRQEHRRAAELFGKLASSHVDAEARARALYQRGRSLELAGDREGALGAFRSTVPQRAASVWTASALRAALRIEWTSGRETAAIEIFERLLERRGWREHAARAALFLASSDVVNRRPDRAGAWLDAAAATGEAEAVEIDYWRGRLAELEGHLELGVERYADVLARRPDHPLAVSARSRLARPSLAEARRLAIRRAARRDDPETRLRAWSLLADDDVGFEALRRAVRQDALRLAPDYVELEPVDPSAWPIWRVSEQRLESVLLRLGAWEEVTASTILAHFPVDRPELAVTAARRLQELGEIRRGISVAEITDGAAPDALPPSLRSTLLLETLYPAAHSSIVERWTRQTGTDPYLLLAVVREESRFDPRALSGASARGLTQFVLPTARRLAPRVDRPELTADDLYEPEIALALGATYLGDLKREFDGRRHEMIAAYNAGEAQARLWRGYCESADPAEYITKIGFRQTRAYVARVLTSWQRYRELYPVLPTDASAAVTRSSAPPAAADARGGRGGRTAR